jgi:haloalkane dehalogenase
MTRRVIPTLVAVLMLAGPAAVVAQQGRAPDTAAERDVVHVAPPTGEWETDRASIVAALEQVRPGGTVQFAAGLYLVGPLIRIDMPGITLLGHPEGTILRGCELEDYAAMEQEFTAAFQRAGIQADTRILERCGQFHLTGGNVTVRRLTFEQSRIGLVLGCCEQEQVVRSFAGGYLIEENVFRNTGNSIRAGLLSEEPTMIRRNEFTNAFHALSAAGSRIHFIDNRVTVPDPASVPFETHPGFGVSISAFLPAVEGDVAPPIEPCAENVIAGNWVEGHPDAVYLFAPPGTSCRDNVIRDNTLIATRVPRPAVWRFEEIWPIGDPDDPTFVGIPLRLWGNDGAAIPAELVDEGLTPGRIQRTIVEGNRIQGADGLGIQLIVASDSRVVANTISRVRVRDPFPGNDSDTERWASANGSAIWLSPGSDGNEVVGNVFEDVAAHAVVIEGDSNVVEVRSANDAVRDEGRSNRVSQVTASVAAEPIPFVRTPDSMFVNLPGYDFEPHYAEVRGQLRVHYVDAGPADSPVIVLLHGEPTWSYLYRRMIPLLAAAGYRVIVPDLVGFGRSDKPRERSAHTYARHVEWMHDLLFERLGLDGITLFAQDWGGLIGLRLVAEHPERFARVAIANTGLPTGDEPLGDAFMAWLTASQAMPSFNSGAIVQQASASRLSAAEIAAYNAPFPDSTYQAGPRVMPLLVPIRPDQPGADDNRRAWARLRGFEKPFITLFSDQDPITRGWDERFVEAVPGASGQDHALVRGAGHFLQEDASEELATRLIAFIRATQTRE